MFYKIFKFAFLYVYIFAFIFEETWTYDEYFQLDKKKR